MSHIIEDTRNHIRKIHPQTDSVDIQIRKDRKGLFQSKIHIRTRLGVIHASKCGETYRECLDRSFHAILKQIERIKMKRKSKLKMAA